METVFRIFKPEIGVYVTIITAIIAAFLTYRNQLRLRAFEMFLIRRDQVLSDAEKFITRLYHMKTELEQGIMERRRSNVTVLDYEGEILYHKANGAKFGRTADMFIETFFRILNDPRRYEDDFDLIDWNRRLTTQLTSFYGVAHRQVSREIESIAFTFWGNFRRWRLSRWKKVRLPRRKTNTTSAGE